MKRPEPVAGCEPLCGRRPRRRPGRVRVGAVVFNGQAATRQVALASRGQERNRRFALRYLGATRNLQHVAALRARRREGGRRGGALPDEATAVAPTTSEAVATLRNLWQQGHLRCELQLCSGQGRSRQTQRRPRVAVD